MLIRLVKLKNIHIFEYLITMLSLRPLFYSFVILVFAHFNAIAQNNTGCPNANLSMGNFTNWQGFTGNYSNPAASMGIVAGRHTIMTGAGTDPFSCGGLPIVPPGSTSSARLGNSNTGAEGEQLKYTMTVTPQNALFIYKYAAVLEDPGHPPNAQPVFQMRLLDQNGTQIGGNCGQYTVYGGQPGQNFQTCGGVKWLPWTIVGVNLTAYTVTHIVFTQAGCSDTISQTINVLPPPTINFTFNNACVFNVVNTTNNTQDPNLAQVTYQWLWGDGSANGITTNASHTYQQAGTFQLGLAATNVGGCTDTLYQSVTIHPLPPVFAGNDTTICPGFSIPLNATGAVTYSWETGTANGSTYVPQASEMLTVVGTDANGCINSDSINITLFPAAVVDAGPDISECSGTSVTITGSGVANYSWNNGLIDGQTFTPPVGVVTYTVTGTDANGCIDSDQMILTTWANPVVTAGNDQSICEGDSTLLSGSGASTYVWDNGILNNDYFIPTINTTYTVIGTDNNGCTGTDDMNITIEPAAYPSFNAPVLADCTPFSFTLNNTSTGTPFTQAVWTFGNGATATGAGPISYTYNSPGCYDVGLTLTTALGCEWDILITDYLCSYVLPIADFEPSPMNITDLENTSSMINQSAGGSYYAWDFGDGTTSTEFEPVHFFPNTTTANYLVTLIVYTDNGCTDTTNRVVTLTETQLLYVPNTFTPDGNEYNQTWFPVITADFDPYEFTCLIYDRWGELIWENHNHLVGWDGKRLNGKPMQEGVYTWKILIKSPYRDERKAFTGHVTLLR